MPLNLLDLGYDLLNYINDLKNESIFCDKYHIDCDNFIINNKIYITEYYYTKFVYNNYFQNYIIEYDINNTYISIVDFSKNLMIYNDCNIDADDEFFSIIKNYYTLLLINLYTNYKKIIDEYVIQLKNKLSLNKMRYLIYKNNNISYNIVMKYDNKTLDTMVSQILNKKIIDIITKTIKEKLNIIFT